MISHRLVKMVSRARTTLRTGNQGRHLSRVRRKRYACHLFRWPCFASRLHAGFTFVEVLIAVSILSLGSIFIFQSNMMSLDVYGRYAHRLYAQTWADEKIWEAKAKILESDSPDAGQSSGTFAKKGRSYRWELDIEELDAEGFYSIALNVTWRNGSRAYGISRYDFARKNSESQF